MGDMLLEYILCKVLTNNILHSILHVSLSTLDSTALWMSCLVTEETPSACSLPDRPNCQHYFKQNLLISLLWDSFNSYTKKWHYQFLKSNKWVDFITLILICVLLPRYQSTEHLPLGTQTQPQKACHECFSNVQTKFSTCCYVFLFSIQNSKILRWLQQRLRDNKNIWHSILPLIFLSCWQLLVCHIMPVFVFHSQTPLTELLPGQSRREIFATRVRLCAHRAARGD